MEVDSLNILRVSDFPTTLSTRSTVSAMRLVMLLDSFSLLATSCFNTLCVGAALVW